VLGRALFWFAVFWDRIKNRGRMTKLLCRCAVALWFLVSGVALSQAGDGASSDPPEFLELMVGEWVIEHEVFPGPDQESVRFAGRESARLLGGRWLVAEGTREVGGRTMTSILTVGFDASRGHYVATYVDEMQGRMWVYEGRLDEAGRVLTLETEGPFMGDPAHLVPFRHVIEVTEDGQLVSSSSIHVPDGDWFEFGRSVYSRP
jgi:hypothetical protein